MDYIAQFSIRLRFVIGSGGSFCFMSWCLKCLCCWRLMYVFIFSVQFR